MIEISFLITEFSSGAQATEHPVTLTGLKSAIIHAIQRNERDENGVLDHRLDIWIKVTS